MTYSARLGICVVVSVASHLLLARGTVHLPARVEAAQSVVLRVNLTQPAPEPEPEPEKADEPKKQPEPEARSRRAAADTQRRVNAPKDVPPPTERPATTDDATNVPVFGISMESTSAAGNGPVMRVGNTLQTKPRDHEGAVAPSGVKPLAAPVQAYEVTKMPLPKGDCSGQYTEEARAAGLEGIVILDLVVDEQGRARDIKVVQGLGSGLTEAAKRALQGCTFTPGERDGKLVPVRVRSFKIRFRLRESE
jgi:TonB family protein